MAKARPIPSIAGWMLVAFALAAGPAGSPGPVLVELFTSEGCSSCPPADLLLMELARAHRAEVVLLGEHVDYWNRLGWVDPFASAQATNRQRAYAARLGEKSIYTPEMIVDGRAALVGSDRGRALGAIAEAVGRPKAKVALALEPGHPGGPGDPVRLAIQVDGLPGKGQGEPADVYLAVTEDALHSQVLGGENAGRRLDHVAVVRRLIALGHTHARTGGFMARPEVSLDPGWNREHLRLVVFVQGAGCGPVLGASASSLAGRVP